MTTQEAYTKYTIMPNLQLHQLRVAGVASRIVDAFTEPLERKEIITACLFHDMGNIIKFDLQKFPEFLKPEGFEYWNTIRESFIGKYGSDEHRGTYKIANEIGISRRSHELLIAVGFTKAHLNSQQNDYAKKICCYADQRVTPHGVMSLQERLDEGLKRYQDKFMSHETKRGQEHLFLLEQQIFERCNIAPNDITEEKVLPLFEELRNFELS